MPCWGADTGSIPPVMPDSITSKAAALSVRGLVKHFGDEGRAPRFCHARELVQQVVSFCEFHELPPVLSNKALDVAVKNLFAGL